MNFSFLRAVFFNLGVSIFNTLVAFTIGIVALKIIDKYLLTKLEIQEELKKNNISVAIFASTALIFVALIISFGLKI
ncbi:MAG: DUF350 domain-containing protein [Candidatus Omnitrophica bacterium]|nr:DUF350 domain-containing protein [Candidatus Omnitrophota bacterium]